MDSAEVQRLQEALKQAGHDPGDIDGRLGPRTKDALRAYKRQQNVRSDREAFEKLGVDVAGRQSRVQR